MIENCPGNSPCRSIFKKSPSISPSPSSGKCFFKYTTLSLSISMALIFGTAISDTLLASGSASPDSSLRSAPPISRRDCEDNLSSHSLRRSGPLPLTSRGWLRSGLVRPDASSPPLASGDSERSDSGSLRGTPLSPPWGCRGVDVLTRYCDSRYWVKTPMPGPTSRTGEPWRAPTILRAISWSVKKCCPRAFFALTSITRR